MSSFGEIILRALSREISLPDGSDGPGENPLGHLKFHFPDLRPLLSGKRVLDFGCGYGNQAAAIAGEYGSEVTGLDTMERYLVEARKRYPSVRFLSQIPDGERFEVIISQNSMEHFPDPAGVFAEMKSLLANDGRILILLGGPWWSPYGSHMHFFCRIPWLQLWFSEKTIMSVRARYRSDGAKLYKEGKGGLNQMSLRKFGRLIRESGLKLHRLEYRGVKQQDWLTRMPVVREFFTGHVTASRRVDTPQPN